MLTPSQRSTAARRAAYALHARYGSDVIAARARAGLHRKYERLVDPDLTLDPRERAKRAQYAIQSHMSALSLKASQKRAMAR